MRAHIAQKSHSKLDRRWVGSGAHVARGESMRCHRAARKGARREDRKEILSFIGDMIDDEIDVSKLPTF